MEFRYRARDADGNTVTGTLEAHDRKGAVRALRQRRIQPVEVLPTKGGPPQRAPEPTRAKTNGNGTAAPFKAARKEKKTREPKADRSALQKSDAAPAAAEPRPKKPLFSIGKGGQRNLGKKAALPFLGKLHQLHSSGMPLGDSLQLMAQRLNDPRLKELADIHWRDLSEGHSLAASMRRRPDVYDPTLAYLVEAGEATGNLAPILSDIIENLETRQELEKTIRSKLSYPIFVVLMALGVGVFTVTVLLPRIRGMIEQLGDEMSLSAEVLIGLSEFVVQYGPWLVLSLFLAGLALYQWRKTESGLWSTDAFALKVPLLGNIIRCSEVCRASNVMSVLLQNGVNTTETLRLAENTIKNQPMKAAFSASRQFINDGAPFSAAFKRHSFFDPMDLDIVSVGENTGSLVGSFRQVFTTQSRHLRTLFDNLTKGITVLAMGTALGFVALLVFAVVTSILQLSSSLQAR